MSKLREQIGKVLSEIYSGGYDDGMDDDGTGTYNFGFERNDDGSVTDRIIALITEALLSEHAVDAAVAAELMELSRYPTMDIVGYEEMRERQARETAVRILKAAAAGLTTGGQGDG